MLSAFLDGQVFGRRQGTGTPRILALHGWGRSSKDFTGLLSGRDAIALDLAGFGQSPIPPEVWGAKEYAQQVSRVITEHMDGGPVIVVAHSFGGRVALHLAASYPELVSGLVLTGVPMLRLQTEAKSKLAFGFRLARRLAKMGLVPQSVLEKQRQKHGSADYLAAQGVMREILVKVVNEDYREEIAKVQVPVTLVWGELDDAASPAMARQAEEIFTEAQYIEVPGSRHLLDSALGQQLDRAIEQHLQNG